MSPLLFGFILLHLSNCLSSIQSGLEEDVGGSKTENLNGIEEKVDDLFRRMERMDISWKLEKALLEAKLEAKNVEAEDLQNQINENRNKNQEVADRLKSEVEAEVKKELNKVLPIAVEQGLRDLPFEMVCAYKEDWEGLGVVSYDRITVEFNNSDRPGGADILSFCLRN